MFPWNAKTLGTERSSAEDRYYICKECLAPYSSSQLSVAYSRRHVCEQWAKGFVYFHACVKSNISGSKNTRTEIIEHSSFFYVLIIFYYYTEYYFSLIKIMYGKKISLQRIFMIPNPFELALLNILITIYFFLKHKDLDNLI